MHKTRGMEKATSNEICNSDNIGLRLHLLDGLQSHRFYEGDYGAYWWHRATGSSIRFYAELRQLNGHQPSPMEVLPSFLVSSGAS
jgi:hypothetical protein